MRAGPELCSPPSTASEARSSRYRAFTTNLPAVESPELTHLSHEAMLRWHHSDYCASVYYAQSMLWTHVSLAIEAPETAHVLYFPILQSTTMAPCTVDAWKEHRAAAIGAELNKTVKPVKRE